MANCVISAQYKAEPTFFEAGSTVHWSVTSGNATITAGEDTLTVTVETDSDVDEEFTLHCVFESPSYGAGAADLTAKHYRYEYTFEDVDPFRHTDPSKYVQYTCNNTELVEFGGDTSADPMWVGDSHASNIALKNTINGSLVFDSMCASGRKGLVVTNDSTVGDLMYRSTDNDCKDSYTLYRVKGDSTYSIRASGHYYNLPSICMASATVKNVNSTILTNNDELINIASVFGTSWFYSSVEYSYLFCLGIFVYNSKLYTIAPLAREKKIHSVFGRNTINIQQFEDLGFHGIELIELASSINDSDIYTVTSYINRITGEYYLYVNGALFEKILYSVALGQVPMASTFNNTGFGGGNNNTATYIAALGGLFEGYSDPSFNTLLRGACGLSQPTTDKYHFIVGNIRAFISDKIDVNDITPCQAAKINKTDYDAYQ